MGVTMKRLTFISIFFIIFFTTPSVYSGTTLLKGYLSKEELPKARVSEASGTVLTKVEKAFIKGDYEGAVTIANDYLTRRVKSDDKLQCLMGRALLKLNRFEEARDHFSKVINESESDKFLDEAYIGLANSYYLENDYINAKEYYERVIRYFPDSDNLAIVYCRLGECYSKLGDGSASKGYYDKLVKLYPDSLEAKLLVREDLGFVIYSVQVGSFSRWGNAKKLCDELKNKGFDSNIFTVIFENERFYRVRVGQYGSLGEAEDMARTLQNKGYDVKIYP